MSDLPSRMNSLSPAKRALLERKLRDKEAQQVTGPLRPESAGKKPPLSFAQQRLWFLDQWQPGSAAYNIAIAKRLRGSLNVDVLDRALTEIVRRHETMRTTFAADGAAAIQLIHPPKLFCAHRIDLSEVPLESKDAEVSRMIEEAAGHPFDLVGGPLFRVTLFRLEPEHHVLMWIIHHIVSDGWSMGVFQQELSRIYGAFLNGQSSPVAELPIQYADFAVWQRRNLQGGVLAEQLSYWREQLSDVATLDLPTDHPRPPMQTFIGATADLHVPQSVVERLKSITRKEHATLFMTLLAAFQTLLHRYTGQDDVVVGTPIAGRTRVEIEPLIGFFVNMLVLRADTSGDPTFRELLRRVAKVALDAYTHQDVPFEKLVEEVQPRRDPSRNPLFQVVFALQNMAGGSLTLDGLNVSPVDRVRRAIRFDLEVHFFEVKDGLSGLFIYNSSLFEAATINRMAQHFRALLEGIVANPDERLSQLPLLTQAEQHQLLVEWNQTKTDYPRDACIQDLFELQTKAAPDALAVAFEREQLTYQQLNDRSNQLAHHLRSLGVVPDGLVGICVERSVDMIVGCLGILKAGGAYLPLEPSYPPERLAFMTDDSKISVVLTQEKLRPVLPGGLRVVCLDAPGLADLPNDNPPRVASANNLAYVIYTSGSTGRPKGVSVPHRAVVRLVVETNFVQLNPADRVAQASNASFDAATFEIWGALLNGASLIGIPQHVLLSPKDLRREIREQRISTLFMTPALFNQMANDAPDSFQSLRYLLIGGDVCDPKSVRRILQDGTPQHFLNAYGPTENTTFTTWHRVERVDDNATTIPIGRPLSNTRVYVLDRNLQPVPIGVVGELYIGGDGLAREYLNRPELTAEKFIQDPFSTSPSRRLYRSGDFVRYLPDGSIDFLGRVDQQVKVRGFRIELQEIEAVLSQHAGVSTSVVVAKQKNEQEKRLVAYVVPSSTGAEVSSEDLRQWLRQKLPEYMVPSSLMVLNSLPLTPNGKVNHAALPEPEESPYEDRDQFVRPSSSTEESLAEMWQELLGVKQVSMRDNFFDLGGHSLLAMQLIARVEKKFGINLPVATLFQSPTIGELAKVLDADTTPESWSSLIRIQTKGSKLPFFWIHGDSSNVLLPAYLGPDQPLYGLEHQAHDGTPARYTEVATITNYYIEQIRTVRPHGPYLLGGFSFGALIAFEMAHQLREEGEDVPLLFMLDPPHVRKRVKSPMMAREELRKHWRALALLGFREKVDYLVIRVKDQISQKTSPIRRVFRKVCWKCYLAAGRSLPVSLRSPYILHVYQESLRSYIPRPYTGRVTLFKSTEAWYRPSRDWTKLITGELDVHEGDWGHMDMRKKPSVAEWAKHLKASLDRVLPVK